MYDEWTLNHTDIFKEEHTDIATFYRIAKYFYVLYVL